MLFPIPDDVQPLRFDVRQIGLTTIRALVSKMSTAGAQVVMLDPSEERVEGLAKEAIELFLSGSCEKVQSD